MYWTTQDGRKIPITELEDAHLLNIAKHLVRGAKASAIQQAIALCRMPDVPDEVVNEIISGDWDGVPEHWHTLVIDPRYQVINQEMLRRGWGIEKFQDIRDWTFEPTSTWYQ
jgi:hypothetical protein